MRLALCDGGSSILEIISTIIYCPSDSFPICFHCDIIIFHHNTSRIVIFDAIAYDLVRHCLEITILEI